MSVAVAVSHGAFGRAALYDLSRGITNHAHREGHLIFGLSGEPSEVNVAGQAILCDGDVAAAVSPWQVHSFTPLSKSVTMVILYIKPSWFMETCHAGGLDFRFGSNALLVSKDMKALVNRLAVQLMSDEDDKTIERLLIELTNTCYETSWKGRHRPQLVDQTSRFNDYRIRRSQRLMTNYIRDHDGLDALASEVGLSRAHFFKLFKRQIGITPNVYFNTLRAEQAIETLVATDRSVTEIADELGFASQASFTRFFSLNVGITPTDYRRVARQ